jgi:hypothetical protein
MWKQTLKDVRALGLATLGCVASVMASMSGGLTHSEGLWLLAYCVVTAASTLGLKKTDTI